MFILFSVNMVLGRHKKLQLEFRHSSTQDIKLLSTRIGSNVVSYFCKNRFCKNHRGSIFLRWWKLHCKKSYRFSSPRREFTNPNSSWLGIKIDNLFLQCTVACWSVLTSKTLYYVLFDTEIQFSKIVLVLAWVNLMVEECSRPRLLQSLRLNHVSKPWNSYIFLQQYCCSARDWEW